MAKKSKNKKMNWKLENHTLIYRPGGHPSIYRPNGGVVDLMHPQKGVKKKKVEELW